MALDGLTKMAAQAYAPWLRVNAIAPGITLRSSDQTEQEYRIAHAFNPLGTGASCDDIIRIAKMILDTPSMTGHTIVVDGGLHLRPPNRDVAFLDK
jgi:NAD(P)-dependent dehydrogenase (short-subunit alcohol dehydrogenase family)